MNPLTAQQITRQEQHSNYQTLTNKEASTFLRPRFNFIQGISKLFGQRSQGQLKEVNA